ncbi:hypothetical protein NEMBOFW57_004373 [Staphylotrichum longicolle]|uniref:Transmembrane protein n=1 Tax=Staphylotrichum longicolle TaxID=669026 RepID=A0AAD4I3K7_9PEZI|nr:hypothetical protein NEMBOFW57_004373 [Staphylotrichum longicolle]
MAPFLLSVRHGPSEGSSEPLSGIVISVALSMLSASALSAFTNKYIIRSGNKKPRLKSKLYCFNSFGMIGLYSYKNSDRIPGSRKLKTMATRTFIGCICTLISSIVNLSVLVGLNGEPGWVCLMCCNSDILFSAVVIHWVTSRDSTTTTAPDDTIPASSPRNNPKNNTATHLSSPGDELSAIPPRAARQRLPSSSSSSGDCCCAAGDDAHTLDHDRDQKHEQENNNNKDNTKPSRKSDHRRRSVLSITTADAPATLLSPSELAAKEEGRCSDGTAKQPFSILTTNNHDDDNDDDEAPSLGAAVGRERERERQQRAMSEVRVDVDYGRRRRALRRKGKGGEI